LDCIAKIGEIVLTPFIAESIRDSIKTGELLLQDSETCNLIELLACECVAAIDSGGKIIFAGNGSSYSDAQRLSGLLVTRHRMERKSLPSVCLGSSGATLTAIGNDYGFSDIFARELHGVGASKDVLICLTTSGNSENLIELIKAANKLGLSATAISGASGGKLKALCRHIKVPSDDKSRIQEFSVLIGHILIGLIERKFFLRGES
jgi:D-sedoheptulose 7-phosphate isomerase